MAAEQPNHTVVTPQQGVDALIAGVSVYAAECLAGRRTNEGFIVAVSDDYAYIRVADLVHPYRFLRQAASAPRQLGTSGFHADVVDDLNPARHYIAFVFVGYWLPTPFARAALWMWEVASFIRYRGHWSAKDITSGNIGIRHGRLVRRFGPVVLPGLIAAEMASNTEDTQTLDNVLYVYSLGMA